MIQTFLRYTGRIVLSTLVGAAGRIRVNFATHDHGVVRKPWSDVVPQGDEMLRLPLGIIRREAGAHQHMNSAQN